MLAITWAIIYGSALKSIHFTDVAAKAGVAAQMVCGRAERNWIPEANGSGVAWLDYDNDGWQDLLIVNGGDMEIFGKVVRRETPPPRINGVFLYRNLGNGKFQDVTARSGLTNPYWGTGANAADFNNDGYPDILITNIGRDLLFRNNKNGTFTDVSKVAGLTQDAHWHTGSTFGDYDGDRHLDLYISGYVAIDAQAFTGTPPVCLYRGVPGFCGPIGLKGEPDILYRSKGDGTFADVTVSAGVTDQKRYHGFSALFHDFNGDGRPDIFVANDSDPNYLYVNQGNGKFQESALASGLGFNDNGQTMANMGIALGDVNNDGLLDLLTTVFSEDYFPLFLQVKAGFYEDASARTGISIVTRPWLGWACGFADLNNDGEKDLWLANGHVYPKAGMLGTTTYLQPFAVLENRGGQFSPVPNALDHSASASHRGGAAADFDNDGRVDVVVTPIEGVPRLLRNDSTTVGNWIGFQLTGTTSNRDALGSIVKVEYCGKSQVSAVVNGGSYLSRNDARVHFGLGSCKLVDRVSILWPNGKARIIERPAVGSYHSIQQ